MMFKDNGLQQHTQGSEVEGGNKATDAESMNRTLVSNKVYSINLQTLDTYLTYDMKCNFKYSSTLLHLTLKKTICNHFTT